MYALFDADILVFRCGLAAERNVWHLSIPSQDYEFTFNYKREAVKELDKRLPGVYSRQEGDDYKLWPEKELEPLSHALQNVKGLVSRTLDELGMNEFDARMYLSASGGQTFRHGVATTKPYKGNRDRSHRPTYEQEIREYIHKSWETFVAVDEEADDLLGIEQTRYGDDSVIITLDKDLDQIAGPKYNFSHRIPYSVSKEEAYYNLHMQMLTGDSTDNIPGLPRIGAGKAAKALHGLETEQQQMEEVIHMYQVHSGKEDWEGYLREQARLVYIRRQPNEMWDIPEYADYSSNEVVSYNLYED